jgi:hypothetical protein
MQIYLPRNVLPFFVMIDGLVWASPCSQWEEKDRLVLVLTRVGMVAFSAENYWRGNDW